MLFTQFGFKRFVLFISCCIDCRLCTSLVDPESISAFITCRLIPFDKSPGVRPFGIGEIPRIIISKAVWILQPDILDAAKRMFDENDTEAALLVDAENAFNKINRKVALHNVSVLLSIILHYSNQHLYRASEANYSRRW